MRTSNVFDGEEDTLLLNILPFRMFYKREDGKLVYIPQANIEVSAVISEKKRFTFGGRQMVLTSFEGLRIKPKEEVDLRRRILVIAPEDYIVAGWSAFDMRKKYGILGFATPYDYVEERDGSLIVKEFLFTVA